ncbi:3-hydroxy-3-methylglutaryl-coenzyme A (HMG-CoA) reductase isozyme [Sarracenia purpurea var. burkii]
MTSCSSSRRKSASLMLMYSNETNDTSLFLHLAATNQDTGSQRLSEVDTAGGGTQPASNSRPLATVVAGSVLARELSLMSAIAAGQIVNSHPKVSLDSSSPRSRLAGSDVTGRARPSPVRRSQKDQRGTILNSVII